MKLEGVEQLEVGEQLVQREGSDELIQLEVIEQLAQLGSVVWKVVQLRRAQQIVQHPHT